MKGQAAMEYLMTYGWAILIVIAVIAALYAMGIFTPGKGGVPCSQFSYFGYIDYSTTDKLLVIRAPTGKAINITNVTLGGTTLGIYFDKGKTNSALNQRVEGGTDLYIDATPFTTGTNYITINYIDLSSGLTHTDSPVCRI